MASGRLDQWITKKIQRNPAVVAAWRKLQSVWVSRGTFRLFFRVVSLMCYVCLFLFFFARGLFPRLSRWFLVSRCFSCPSFGFSRLLLCSHSSIVFRRAVPFFMRFSYSLAACSVGLLRAPSSDSIRMHCSPCPRRSRGASIPLCGHQVHRKGVFICHR